MSWADYELSNGRQRLVNEADPTQDLSLQKNQTFPTERNLAHNGSAYATVIDLIEIIVNEYPESEALRFGAHSLTFKELDILSTRLARYLQSKGIKEEIMVPVCMDRSLEMIIGILGVLKAGGAFVPIDPQLPQSRIKKILQETDAAVVLTHQQTNGKIAGIKNSVEIIEWEKIESILNSPTELPSTSNRLPEHLAYVIFTSGSTGKPKGVLVEHRQLLSATQARNSYYDGFSNVLLVPALAFDASLAAIFGSLCSGGCLFICSQEDLQNPHQLEQLIPQLDTLLCVPSYYRFLLEEGLLKNANLSKVILGGEVISPELVHRHFEANSGALLYNEYGPTETTIWATVEQINPTDQRITVGRPIEGVEAYILDPDGKVLEDNIIGELYLGGKGVTRGYLNDPHKTAANFIDNPFSTSRSRLYKTGDLCYQLPDRRIVFVGRVDDQIKINGYRMEVGEIESALQHLQGVRQAAVIVKKREQGIPYLAAFVQCTKKLDQQSLRDNLRTQLPDYMIPNVWVQLDNFPLTANGKIDRQALQAFGNNETHIASFKRPSDPVEDPLIDLWQYHLPVQNITVEDDFFDLGGNSIMAMALIASIRREFNVDISVSDLFQHRTIAKLAKHFRFNSTEDTAQADSIPTSDSRPEEVPLSFGQEALWLIDKLGEGPSYHLSIALQIEGDLNVEALTSSLRDLLQRHEALRTIITETEENHLQQLLPLDDWKLVEILSPMAQDDLNQLIRSPFDLSKDFMLRAWLIEKAPKENILLFVIHHIAFDAWSKRIFLEELWSGYSTYANKTSASLPPLPLQYTDYAHWQRAISMKGPYGEKMAYWKTKLQDLSPLQLPGDFIAGPKGIEGAVKTFSIPPAILDGLKTLSKRQGSTLFMTLLAGFKALLYKYSSQEDICVGTAIAGREVPGTESLIGYFINSLALRTEVKGEAPFLELLDKVKHTTLEAYEAKDIPFEKVVAEIGVDRMVGQNPLFQVMFNFQNVPQAHLGEIEGLKLSSLDIPQTTSKFDLTFSLKETEEGLDGVVEFRTGRYVPSTIERMIQHYVLLLESAVYNPSERVGKLNILSDVERKQLLSEFNQTAKKYPPNITVLDLLEEQARKTPDKVAVLFGDQEITYKTLDEKSNQLAHLLQEKGAREETLILLCMQRSLEMVIAVVGILKSGAAYVPIDPAYPQDRKKFIQEDTAAKLAVTDADNQKELSLIGGAELLTLEVNNGNLSQYPSHKVTTSVQPDHLAYVIYTSGSTGKPKGVMIEHQNVYSFISWCKEEFSATPYDVVYASTSICFDLSVFEIFHPLSTGVPIRLLQDGLEAKAYLPKDQKVMINTVPSVVGHLLEEGTDLSNVSVLNMAGEPITKSILEELDVNKIEVRNLYGPTEDTTYSTIYRIGSEREILIGKPISNTSVYIVNQECGLSPVGIPGELCLGGSGLARGYFRRPDLTEEKFVPNPFVQTPGARMYKTGDIARWLPNGQIEYLGRRDDQVKIRGYRIELGEIERVLQQHEKVRQAVVSAKADHKGNQQLVGYLAVDGLLDKKSIMVYLQQRLPLYMVPSLWVQLEAFPLTPNGKIDKKKLSDPYQDGHVENEFVAPRNETEKKLAQIWKDLLGTKMVGIYDDFFALGGHSLLATRFIAAIRKEYEVDLRIQDLFSFPTIAGLTENCDFRSKSSPLPALQAHLPRPEGIPLSYNQESLWFIDQLSGSNHYHIPLLLRLEGVLDQHALDLALKNILKRHEVLRTTIQNNNGVPHQVITDHAGDFITVIDGDSLRDDPEEIQQIIARLIDQPFDFSTDHMIRGSLIALSHESHLLVLVIHHIAFDGWSTSLLLDELAVSYKAYKEGRRPLLPPLTLQYSDYAIWQKQFLQGDLLRTQLSYWKEKLHNTAPLQLPLDYRRPPIQRYEGSVALSRIDNNLKERLAQIGQARSATLFMTLLTAFKVLLYRYSSQQDICVGTVTAGRHQKDIEQLIGYFTQTLPIRSKINPESTFEELLQEVKSTSLEAFENQQVPFEKIVAAVGVERDLSKNPLFQVMFIVQNYAEATTLELDDVIIAQQPVKQVTSKFDLSFIIAENSSELHLSVEYNTNLFKQRTVDQLSADYISLLHHITSNPSGRIGQYPLENGSQLVTNGVPPAVHAPKAVGIENGRELVDVNLQQQKTETFERIIKKIWVGALGVKHIDVNDNFFEIGGQSLVAVQVMTLLEKELGIKLPLSILFKHPTIKEMARVIVRKDRKAKSWKSLVPIKTKGNKSPLYIIHGGGANILPFYDIAKNMDPDQPVYGLQPKGLNGKEKPLKSVEAIASHFIKEVLHHNPEGPICLAGYSFGGIIAYEMAKQLKDLGKEVKHLVMFDTIAYQSDYRENWQVKLRNRLKQNITKRSVDLYLATRHRETFKRIKMDSLRQKLKRLRIWLGLDREKPATGVMKIIKNIEDSHREAAEKYVLTPFDGTIHLMKAKIPTYYNTQGRYLGWDAYVKSIAISEMDGEHTNMFSPPHDVKFAQTLQRILDA